MQRQNSRSYMYHPDGVLYMVIGLMLIITCMAVFYFGQAQLGWGVLLTLPLARVGWYFIHRGRRCFQPPAEELFQDDRRPPILYLRSFLDENERQSSHWFDLKPGFSAPDPRVEDIIAPVLGCLGPFVAVGKPGEELPQTGASRLYLDDEQWKPEVAALMSRARIVVILGCTPSAGVQWEVLHAVRTLRPEQLVLIFPAHGSERDANYAAFRDATQAYFSRALPERLGNASFLRFGPDWTPEPMTARSSNPLEALRQYLDALVQRIEPGFVMPPMVRGWAGTPVTNAVFAWVLVSLCLVILLIAIIVI